MQENINLAPRFSFFLEKVYREPRDQPKPGSLREEEIGLWERVCGEEGTLYQYQEKLHTKVTDVTASHKKKYLTSNY